MSLLWATRGHTWGFRVLRCTFPGDPLRTYSPALAALGDAAEGFRREGGMIALRLLDPEGRRDRSGRPIPHEFVADGPDADGLEGLEDARERLWPLVGEEYGAIWDHPSPT